MSSTSSGCQPNRSARMPAWNASGASRWIQVSPAAVSSAGGDGGAETATTVSRERARRMRGRLGIGTEWILEHGDHVHIRHSIAVSRLIDGCEWDHAIAVGDALLDRECAERRDEADGRGKRPERERPPGEDEAADRGTHRSREPPGERVHREIAAAQMIWGDLGDQRLVRRAVEALADAEDRERDRHH